MNKIGRRMSLTSSLLLCGVTCIAGGFIPEEWLWLKIVLFLTGKMGITSSFAIVYVYSGKAFFISILFFHFYDLLFFSKFVLKKSHVFLI